MAMLFFLPSKKLTSESEFFFPHFFASSPRSLASKTLPHLLSRHERPGPRRAGRVLRQARRPRGLARRRGAAGEAECGGVEREKKKSKKEKKKAMASPLPPSISLDLFFSPLLPSNPLLTKHFTEKRPPSPPVTPWHLPGPPRRTSWRTWATRTRAQLLRENLPAGPRSTTPASSGAASRQLPGSSRRPPRPSRCCRRCGCPTPSPPGGC